MRELTSDQLGTAGERKFPTLCDATLTCNKVGEDRTGWDFHVEWPSSNVADLPYDLQPSPLSCQVQVKARWEDSEFINVTVSSIGRLAHEPRPAFIYVLSYDKKKQAAGARIIPIRGQFLAEILRQERLAFIDGKKRNKKFFRFKPDSWGCPIELEVESFKNFVETYVGPDIGKYMEDKKSEYENLGYEKGRLIVRGKFKPINRDGLRSAFLHKSDIQVDVTSVLDNRFGLETPSQALAIGPASVKFDMTDAVPCTVTLWPGALSSAVTFEGTWQRLPDVLVESGHVEAVFQSEVMTITAKTKLHDGQVVPEGFEMSLQIDGARILSARLKPIQWRDFYHVMIASISSAMKFSMQAKDRPPFTGEITMNHRPGDHQFYERMNLLAKIVEKAFRITGKPNTELGINDFYRQGPALIKLDAFLNDNFDGSMTFETEKHDFLKDGDQISLLYFGTIPLGVYAIMYCLVVDFASTFGETEVEWTSTRIQAHEIIRIDTPTTEILDSVSVDFLDRMRVLTGIQNYYFEHLPAPLPA